MKEELPSNSDSQLGKQLMAEFKELKGNTERREEFMIFTEEEQKAIRQKEKIEIATKFLKNLNKKNLSDDDKLDLLADILGDENKARAFMEKQQEVFN